MSYVTFIGKQMGSKRSRSASSSTVMALLKVNWFVTCSDAESSDIVTRAASINYFCKQRCQQNSLAKFCIIQRIPS